MKQKALFITTKNIDYLRNVQEIRLLKEQGCDVEVLYSGGKNYIKRMLDIYSKLLFKNVNYYDRVFIGFSPQLIIPLFAWKFRKKVVEIDFFISVYDTFVNDRKKIRPNSVIAKIMHKIDKMTIQRADYVVADTKAHKQYFVEEFGVEADKIHVEYLEADKEIYYPRKVEKDDKFQNKFLVLYFGSILPLQGVEVVMGAVKKLIHYKDIHFLIIGPMKGSVEKTVSDTVTYYNWLPQVELAEKIAMADLCLAGHFCPTINKADRTIPGKAYIYSAMEKPIILGDTSANHELFEEDDNICFVERGNAEKLAASILEMKQRLQK